MLQIVMGRAHTGKSRVLLERICQQATSRDQLLIVPEQHSHNSERALAALGGGGVSLRAEVLSFSRLANRVFADAGGLAAPTLDEGGRLLLLHRAVKLCSGQLRALGRTQISFLRSLLKTVDECKSFLVTPDQLHEAAQAQGDSGEKLGDMGLILAAYDALLAQTALDPRDKLTQLEEKLKQTNWCRDKDIYIDGFTDFTRQERQVIRRILAQANSVNIALTCDKLTPPEEETDIFAPARQTAQRILEMARPLNIEREVIIQTEYEAPFHPALAHAERHLFSVRQPVYRGEEAVVLHVASSPYGELEWVAAEIRRLVREEGYRYRDIAVVARSMAPYEGIGETVFARYEIPLFFAAKSLLLERPVMVLVLSALDCAANHYPYETLFRYLKTSLTGISLDDIDRLENYALTWSLRGSAWTAKKPWDKHPDGFGGRWTEETAQRLAELDNLRRQVIAPLELLRRSGATTIGDHARAFYRFLEHIGLPTRLANLAAELIQRGELTQAEETRQVWSILCDGLDQCVAIAGEVPADLDEFSKLLALVLGQYEIGSIPVSLDRVTMQEYNRLGAKRPRALFLIGADDTAVPQVSPAAGIFSEDDRVALEQVGAEVSSPATMRLLRELTMIYETCAAPRERLIVSFVAQGEQSAPSLAWTRLHDLFPNTTVTREEALSEVFRLSAPLPALEIAARHPAAAKALEQLPDYAERLVRMRRAAVLHRGSLSPTAVEALYTKNISMSASRLDKLKACHFSDYMRYGLRAKERHTAKFDAPVYGTFVHYVLEYVLARAGKAKDISGADLDRLVDHGIAAYVLDHLGDLADYTDRFRHLFLRQRDTVRAVARDMLEELSRSAFEPRGFELSFGRGRQVSALSVAQGDMTLELGGFVDRVDGYQGQDGLYLRVLDYKTGVKAIDWTGMGEGMGLQMLLYLFALEKNGESYFNAPIIPAGVLYVPARDPVVDGTFTMSEAERLKARGKAIRRSGLILAEPEVLAAMETPPEGESPLFLPKEQLEPERFDLLRGYVQKTLEDTARELGEGCIHADPYSRGEQNTACTYCEYFRACHFEDGRGTDHSRYLKTMKSEDFWSRLETQGGDA